MAQKERDPLEVLLHGEKITEVVHTKRGDFTLVFPLPSTLRQIEIDMADLLGGRPITSFTQDTLNSMRAYATLRYVILDGPDWWTELESPEQCPDNNITAELYRRYLQFYTKTQGAMAQGKYRGEVGKIRRSDGTSPADVGVGPLPGSADRPEVPVTDK